MGLFKFGKTPDPTEARLFSEYSVLLEPMAGSRRAAESMARELLQQCMSESRAAGTNRLPENGGDALLNLERSNPEARRVFAWKREDGVRDEDIRWWWNLHDLERRMMMAADDLTRLAAFNEAKARLGGTDEQAAREVWRRHLLYSDSNDATHWSGDDRPLPFELKDRINRFITGQMSRVAEFKGDIERATSMNALIRERIRQGQV